ncbi:MAG: hypothetical protein V2I63_01420 [Pseudomonadales bacterium]|jgi:uncharacterized membrane protein affecting hemolysin expression|nr:hypothetical protein [Pseudomonadales bacterium]
MNGTLRTRHAVVVAAALVLALVVAPLLALALVSLESDATEARARYGSTLVDRLAASAVDAVISGEALSLASLTREFGALEGVASAAIYGADDRLLAAGENASPARLDRGRRDDAFLSEVALQNEIVGYARVTLAPDAFDSERGVLLVAGALVLGLGVLGLAWIAGERLERRLATLRERLELRLGEDAVAADPFRAMIELLDPDSEVEAEGSPTGSDVLVEVPHLPATADAPRASYLIVVNLFNQLALTPEAREETLDRCADLLDLVCARYGGRLGDLPGTGCFIWLDALAPTGDHAFQAICTGLLAARVCADDEGPGAPARLRLAIDRVSDEELPTPGDVVDTAEIVDRMPETMARVVMLSACGREHALAVGEGLMAQVEATDRLHCTRIESAALRVTGEGAHAWLVDDVEEPARGLIARHADAILAADLDAQRAEDAPSS